METFEKKYNEALDWMRKVYPTLTGADKEDAEHYFPELKEQPDPRHSIIEFIKWSCDRGSITPEQRKNVDFWLAYLERQKEQKPAEWSEKDENMLKSIIATCQLAAQDRDSGPAWKLCEMQERFLKSIPERFNPQHNWKPSEEQMTILSDIIEKTTGKKHEVLLGLYQQLKQL